MSCQFCFILELDIKLYRIKHHYVIHYSINSEYLNLLEIFDINPNTLRNVNNVQHIQQEIVSDDGDNISCSDDNVYQENSDTITYDDDDDDIDDVNLDSNDETRITQTDIPNIRNVNLDNILLITGFNLDVN